MQQIVTDHVEANLRAKARYLAEVKRQEAFYAQHPWPFLKNCVLTEDPLNKDQIIRPYPSHLSYLEVLVDEWFNHPRLLVPKSRRMHISWTMIACHVWLAMFREGEHIFFAARKEGKDESEGSLELVARAKFIVNHLQGLLRKPRTIQRVGRLEFPDKRSMIVSVAQGSDQLRQVTATAILADEFAFWEHARETYAAARPTIEGRGRFTGVSSAYPGFFKSLVYDEVR